MEDFKIILLVKNWPINWPIKLYKGGEITLLESLEKEELINIIQKLEKEIPKEQKVISNEEKANHLIECSLEIEQQIMKYCNISPEDINDKSIEKYIEQLREYEI